MYSIAPFSTTNPIVRIVMRRDGLDEDDVQQAWEEAGERLENGDNPEDVFEEEFGLEPDYIFDLLGL